MPKQIYKIVRFEGGVNSKSDPRDIQDNELLSLKSATVDDVGRIRLLGKASADNTGYPEMALGGDVMQPGRGFFIFNYDYTMLEDSDANGFADLLEIREPTLENKEYIVYQDQENTCIFQPDEHTSGGFLFRTADVANNTNGVGTFITGLKNGASAGRTVYPDYFFADKALRISDIGFNNDYKARWVGHIKRNLFGEAVDDTTTQNINFWHCTTTKLMPPSTSAYSETIGSEAPGKYGFQIAPDTTITVDQFKIHIHDAGTDGTWIATDAGDYKIYLSYIYDGSQESPVTKICANTWSVTTDSTVYIGIGIEYYDDSTYKFNPRITGGRVYYSDIADGHGIKYHLLDVDFVQGCRKFDETEYTAWAEISTGEGAGAVKEHYECPDGLVASSDISGLTNIFAFEDMPKTVTYDMLNGYGADEVTYAEYKCSTIFNNRVYIGNIRQVNKVGDAYGDDTPTYNDRIIRSPINFEGKPQYDTFPATHKMDVAANDGDDITALKGLGDRLLIFKLKSVYIVNVAQDGAEFVENKLFGLGVESASQVVETEYGIVWIRSSGCYIYSGEGKPVNLIENKLGVIANPHAPHMNWNIEASKVPTIVYLPNEKKLIIGIAFKKNHSNDAWVFDFRTKSWCKGGAVLGDWQKTRSNIALSSSGTALFAEYTGSSALKILAWDDSPAATSSTSGEFEIKTKDIDFGQPAQRKNIYKIYVNFRTRTAIDAATNVLCTYQINGSASYTGTWASTSNGIQSDGSTYTELNEVTNAGTNAIASLAALSNHTWTNSAETHNEWTLHTASGDGVDDDDDTENFSAKIVKHALRLHSSSSSNNDGIIYDTVTPVANAEYEVAFSYGGTPSLSGSPSQGRCLVVYDSGSKDPTSTFAFFRHADNKLLEIITDSPGYYRGTFTAPASGNIYIGFDLNALTGDVTTEFMGTTLSFPRISLFRNLSLYQHSEWSTAILKPNTNVRKVYSFGLKFTNDGAIGKDFEIGDISFIYRPLKIK